MRKEELINQIFDNLSAMKRSMHGRLQSSLASSNITHSQLELMMLIKRLQPTYSKQLALELHLTPGAVSQLIEAAVESKLVLRTEGTSDRRYQSVSLTSLGQKKLNDIEKKRNEMMRGVLEDLNDNELEIILKVQTKLASMPIKDNKQN
jgi:DNA-binding MarR family transcriptional regulator